ncbi:MAG: hypothetical protein H6753_00990 [Candidatus Omnitrophica bacterium]|nr:hypothetical protein [Candidatus Omnitrophota bacterium]
MSKINEVIQNEFKKYANKYGSLVFASIPNYEDPVVIFKSGVVPFLMIAPSIYYVGRENVFDFIVYWQGKFMRDCFPPEFLKHYNEKIAHARETPGEFVYPEGMFEIPIDAVLLKGIFQIEKDQFQLAKDVLRKYGLIEERRGKFKSVPAEKEELKQIVIKSFQGMEKKTPLPMGPLLKILDIEVAKRYPNDSDKAKADKLKFSDAAIRRWLKPFTKK